MFVNFMSCPRGLLSMGSNDNPPNKGASASRQCRSLSPTIQLIGQVIVSNMADLKRCIVIDFLPLHFFSSRADGRSSV